MINSQIANVGYKRIVATNRAVVATWIKLVGLEVDDLSDLSQVATTALLAATLSRITANERSMAKKWVESHSLYFQSVQAMKEALASDIVITTYSGDGITIQLLEELEELNAKVQSEANTVSRSLINESATRYLTELDRYAKAQAFQAISESLT